MASGRHCRIPYNSAAVSPTRVRDARGLERCVCSLDRLKFNLLLFLRLRCPTSGSVIVPDMTQMRRATAHLAEKGYVSVSPLANFIVCGNLTFENLECSGFLGKGEQNQVKRTQVLKQLGYLTFRPPNLSSANCIPPATPRTLLKVFQPLARTAIMKLSVALLPALLSVGSATTLAERRNSELQQRASCADPQYYCRYGFCCDYAESCDVGGCNGGSSGAAICSVQGVSFDISLHTSSYLLMNSSNYVEAALDMYVLATESSSSLVMC